MNPLLPNRIGAVACVALVVPVLTLANPSRHAITEGDEASRVHRLERELKKASHDLVMAHRELAARLEQIARLEEELATHSANVPARGEVVGPALVTVAATIQPAERRESGGAVMSPQLTVADDQEARESFTKVYRVSHAALAAVNYEARDEVVAWLERSQIRESDRIVIRALSNDTAYPVTNQEIANNRANYLAAYLRQQGVPAHRIATVEGRVSDVSGARGREVSVVIERAMVEEKPNAIHPD